MTQGAISHPASAAEEGRKGGKNRILMECSDHRTGGTQGRRVGADRATRRVLGGVALGKTMTLTLTLPHPRPRTRPPSRRGRFVFWLPGAGQASDRTWASNCPMRREHTPARQPASRWHYAAADQQAEGARVTTTDGDADYSERGAARSFFVS